MTSPTFRKLHAGRGLVERSACAKLFELAGTVPPDEAIVELGAYCGRSTGYLLAGSRLFGKGRVWSVDPWDTLEDVDPAPDEYRTLEAGYRNGNYVGALEQWRQHLESLGLREQARAVQMTATAAAADWAGPKVGLLFHDARHDYESVYADISAWLPHLSNRATIACHDACAPGFGVVEATVQALRDAGWPHWSQSIMPWRKRPDRRGLLVITR